MVAPKDLTLRRSDISGCNLKLKLKVAFDTLCAGGPGGAAGPAGQTRQGPRRDTTTRYIRAASRRNSNIMFIVYDLCDFTCTCLFYLLLFFYLLLSFVIFCYLLLSFVIFGYSYYIAVAFLNILNLFLSFLIFSYSYNIFFNFIVS